MIKTVSKLGLEKNFFNWIKVNYQNSTVICILPNRAASEAGLKKKNASSQRCLWTAIPYTVAQAEDEHTGRGPIMRTFGF